MNQDLIGDSALEENEKLRNEIKRLKAIIKASIPALRYVDKACIELWHYDGTDPKYIWGKQDNRYFHDEDEIINYKVLEDAREAVK